MGRNAFIAKFGPFSAVGGAMSNWQYYKKNCARRLSESPDSESRRLNTQPQLVISAAATVPVSRAAAAKTTISNTATSALQTEVQSQLTTQNLASLVPASTLALTATILTNATARCVQLTRHAVQSLERAGLRPSECKR